MKKRKTYEVSVVNKTSSRLLSDQTKFYTSDTALELVFKLKEVEYDFDSAELILLNDEDRSVTTRPVKKTAEGFTYDLEDDIIEHYGTWSGQLKFTEDGEYYISSPIGFRIHNDLYNDRPPRMSDVNTWKNLRKIADGLISDIRSELELFEEKKLEIETSESERQSAETQRASAESSRVSAEAQRKTDHSNRSAELASKADKVVINNFIENGDVESSYTFETSSYINFLKTGGIVGPLNYSNTQSIIPAVSGHEYYVRAVFSQGTVRERLYFIYEDNSASFNDGVLVETDMVSGIITAIKTANANLRMYGSAGEKTKKSVMMIDLTATFGAGSEPTKEEMDKFIDFTGYIDGEYALNNKEMLIWTLALIRRNKNAIITLGGTI